MAKSITDSESNSQQVLKEFASGTSLSGMDAMRAAELVSGLRASGGHIPDGSTVSFNSGSGRSGPAHSR